jgi:Fe-S cluster assembly protein SufD
MTISANENMDCGLRRNDGKIVLPTPKLERWKYSNLPAYVGGDYKDEPIAVGYDGDDAFIDTNELDTTPWAQDDYGDMQLWDGLQDVMHIRIPANTACDTPINLTIEIAENVKASGHIYVTLEGNASATIYDVLDCEGWCNRAMTITLAKGAQLNHIRTRIGDGVTTGLLQIRQEAESHYNGYVLNNSGKFVRDQIHARLEGENGKCDLSGAKILKDDQHSDTCILIEHEAVNCYSNQNYRNILDGQSRGVFQGKVHVHQIAQQTDGYQLCNSMLLSDRAEMDTKPELEIYADDVKCSHGATTAQADAEPLFYLMARGIPEGQAKAMLMQAFVAESLEAFEDNEEIYAILEQKIADALA